MSAVQESRTAEAHFCHCDRAFKWTGVWRRILYHGSSRTTFGHGALPQSQVARPPSTDARQQRMSFSSVFSHHCACVRPPWRYIRIGPLGSSSCIPSVQEIYLTFTNIEDRRVVQRHSWVRESGKKKHLACHDQWERSIMQPCGQRVIRTMGGASEERTGV